VQVLANEAIRLDIPIFNHATAIRILVQPEPPRRVCDVLVVRPKHRPKKPTVGP
jgi:succinate dehydrogenase / fumarate reductase, flavoprotein subunit